MGFPSSYTATPELLMPTCYSIVCNSIMVPSFSHDVDEAVRLRALTSPNVAVITILMDTPEERHQKGNKEWVF